MDPFQFRYNDGDFNDDEPIVLPPGKRPTIPGRVQLVIRNNDKAPLEENSQKVMLELTGEEESRSGLDLVVVNGSMRAENLHEFKLAMLYVMNKLSVVDRLSIVMYSDKAERLRKLRQMAGSSKMELENLIKDLKSMGGTDITDGLKMALNIFNDRSVSSGRVGAIMLVSDGEENIGNEASVPVGNVPVHTFGFGNGHNPKLLKAITNNSRLGGTYSFVPECDLRLTFSQCLGGLLSVVAQDLTVTVSQIKDESTIKQVSAGSYLQSMDNAAGSVTVTFGDIYLQEVRKVLVDLHLPATRKTQGADVLKVSYRYMFDGESFQASPATVSVCRMSGLTAEEQQAMPEVRAEEVRLLIAEVIKQATTDADKEDLKSAQDKLANGLLKLEDADIEKLKAELRPELEELLKLMQTSQAIYKSQARPFAYSLLNSLATQRQTARGNNIGKFQLFSTPPMQEFLEEAKKLHDIDDHKQYSTDPFTMSFKDDDPISSSGSGWVPRVPGLVQLREIKNNEAPVHENIQKVLLELPGEGYPNSQIGLDLVAVLDVSSSMEGNKLAKMKIAMLLLIDNLHLRTRLSIVEYSSKAKTLCPLREMTQTKHENLINDLKTQPGTNITDGLEMALNVLKDRSFSSGRVGVIILMSDGEQNQGGDAADVPIGNVPVFTFGFEDQHPEVLITIANNSGLGGTYKEVCMDNLNLTFPYCLGELQSVIAWDLTVTVTQIKNQSTVKQAFAGRYLHSKDNAAGSVTITFGTLYRQDVCRVLVHILLPVTKKEGEVEVLKVSYTYRNSFDGELFVANPATVTVRRTLDPFYDPYNAHHIVTVEVKLLIAEVIKQATGVADKEDLKSVRDELVHSLNTLGYKSWWILTYYLREEHLKDLRAELEELSELMQSQAINEKQGRSFAYSLLISNFTQRGLASDKFELYASPAMREFIEEAKMYDEMDDLHVYMDRFIGAIESIQMIIGEDLNVYMDRFNLGSVSSDGA